MNEIVIRFEYQGRKYEVEMEAYGYDKILLPDGRLLTVLKWLETNPPQPIEFKETQYFKGGLPENSTIVEIANMLEAVIAEEISETIDWDTEIKVMERGIHKKYGFALEKMTWKKNQKKAKYTKLYISHGPYPFMIITVDFSPTRMANLFNLNPGETLEFSKGKLEKIIRTIPVEKESSCYVFFFRKKLPIAAASISVKDFELEYAKTLK